MAASVKIKLPEATGNVRTFLSQDYFSGTTLTVDAGGGFVNGNYILVGEPGTEKTECTPITAVPTATTLTVTALNHSHPKGTPIYYTRWDKYSLEYRAVSTDAWAAYATMPVAIRFDALFTEYRDSTATSTYQWQYRYYSTESTVYSDYSDTISYTGWADNTVGYMARNVRKIIGDPEGKTVNDTEILRFFNAAQDKIYALYNRWWFLFKEGVAIPTLVSTGKYGLPTDFGRMHSVLYRYISGATDVSYPLKYISINEYDYEAEDNNAATDDNLAHYTIYPGDSTYPAGYLKIWPKPTTAGLNITPRYYKMFTDLNSYGDVTEVPIPSILEDYALAQIYKIRKEEDKASYYDKIFREQIDLLKLMQRKQAGPPRYLWRYKGRNAIERMYGEMNVYSDANREQQF